MSIIHLRQIETQLKSKFTNLIDLSDYADKKQNERDSAFLSRALAAFAVLFTADITPEKAASSLIDGPQDCGLDAVYFDSDEKNLFFVQSKWRHDGTGSIDQGDALKFINGVKAIIYGKIDRFNKKIKKRENEFLDALSFANTRITLLVVYTGTAGLAKDVQTDFDDFLKEMNDPSEVVELKVIKQAELHQIVASGALGTPINFDVVLKDWGQIREPNSAYYGLVSATSVADWWNKYYPKLFMPNIRSFLGETEINQSIVETLLSEPENFWYFNNGITVLCTKICKKP
ncbi:hypothetical protein BCD67_05930 [Oscillatoriales cyanobacterium USR001]|nr:hypothetical protein BCD67_05930 [Oscillatoriales cyanobacterium USR001]